MKIGSYLKYTMDIGYGKKRQADEVLWSVGTEDVVAVLAFFVALIFFDYGHWLAERQGHGGAIHSGWRGLCLGICGNRDRHYQGQERRENGKERKSAGFPAVAVYRGSAACCRFGTISDILEQAHFRRRNLEMHARPNYRYWPFAPNLYSRGL